MSNTNYNFIFSVFSDKAEIATEFNYFDVQSKLNSNLDPSKFSQNIKTIKFTLIIISDYAPSTRDNFVNHSINSAILEIGINLNFHICQNGSQTEIDTHLVNSILTALLDLPAFENFWPHALYLDILNLFKF